MIETDRHIVQTPRQFSAFWTKYWKCASCEEMGAAAGRLTYSSEEIDTVCDDEIRELQLCQADVLLDLGCAKGLMRERLEPLVARYVGMDYIIHMRPAVVGRAQSLPFRDETFNKVLMAGVLQCIHPDEHGLVLSELFRVTKPGGRAMVASIPFTFIGEMYVLDFRSLASVAWCFGWRKVYSMPTNLRVVHSYADLMMVK